MTAEGIVVSILVPTTPSEQEKLKCKDLERAITDIAKGLHVNWAVETAGVTISKTFGPVIGNAQVCEADIATNAFMSAIRQLCIPCEDKTKHPEEEEDCPVEVASDVVIKFNANGNSARVVKALRECTCVTLEIAKRCAKNGRFVCSLNEAAKIMENLEVVGATDVHIDEQLSNDLNFCNTVLSEWDGADHGFQTKGAILVCAYRSAHVPYGKISGRLLKKLFTAYVESM